HGQIDETNGQGLVKKCELSFAKHQLQGQLFKLSSTVRELISGIREAIIWHRKLHKIIFLHNKIPDGIIILEGLNYMGV
ncbi:BgTH12-04876, partial [Blumeria graminis f. sp. triticale]